MKQRVINFLKRLFGRNPDRSGTPAEAVPAHSEKDVPAPEPHLCIKRVRLVLSKTGMRPRKGRTPGVWYVKNGGFTDAYRLLLHLGKQEGLAYIKRGGHVRYRLTLPENKGCIILSDRAGYRRCTSAVMLFDIEEIPEIKEIRFLSPANEIP